MPKTFDIFNSVLKMAENPLIRGVILNGSRANPNAKKDAYQDFDIVFLTNDTSYFIENRSWLKLFPPILIAQYPDELDKSLGKDVEIGRAHV